MDATPRADDVVDFEEQNLTTPAPSLSYHGSLRVAPAVQRSGWSNRYLEMPSAQRLRAAPTLPNDELLEMSGERAALSHSYQPRMTRLTSRSSSSTSFFLPIGDQSWMTHTIHTADATTLNNEVEGTWMTPSRGYTIATTTTTAGTTIFTRFEDEMHQDDDDDNNGSHNERLNVVSPYMPTLPMHESDDDDDGDYGSSEEFKPPKLKMLCTNKSLHRIHPFATHTK
jgi:hypothetical protein